ncbi:MAG TPA: hypothetical protein VGJ20_20585 [Xanthobacteraceae bacterium]
MITQFSVGTSRTINLGNFESLRVEASITIDVAETDDMVQLRSQAQQMLRQLLEDTYNAQHAERKKVAK